MMGREKILFNRNDVLGVIGDSYVDIREETRIFIKGETLGI